MKLYKGLILLFFSTIVLGGCIPDTFTKWKVQDPSTGGEGGTDPGDPSVPPTDPNVSIPPTDIAYSPPSYPAERGEGTYFFEQTSQTNPGELPTPLTCVALNGGEIREGDMSFFVSQVTTKEGTVTGEQTLPTGMVLNPLTGEITGFAQVFTDGKFYTIQGDHIGGSKVNTTIQISIATKPEALYYPQADGLTLVLDVDRPENFKVGDLVTSNRGAKGTVTYVDNDKKILHVVASCLTTPVDSCPIFMREDKIDNTDGFFIEEAKILEEVTYAFENVPPPFDSISYMTPVVIPAVDGEEPQFSISPDIRQWGVNFNTSTGEIYGTPQIGTCSATPPLHQSPYTSPLECTDNSGVWTYQATINLPVTLFNVTVKNILGETANVQFKLSSLDILAPQAISSIAYNYENDYRVALYVADLHGYSKGSYVSNQDGTLGTVIGMDDIDEGDQVGSESVGEPQPGSILVQIENSSILRFVKDQFIDDTQKYVIPLTQITQEPELVFLLNTNTSIPVTVEPTLSQDELNSLYWKSYPELTHLCNSIANPDTVFYRDENKNDCENNNGFCTGGTGVGTCPEAQQTPPAGGCDQLCTDNGGTWSSDGDWTATNELYFNRRTGKFGASNPTKAFLPQKFEVTVTALDGSETKTEVTFGFQSAPEDLSYSNQAFLEVDKPEEFNVNDFISSLSGAVGIVKSKEIIKTEALEDKEILVVKVMAGEFEQNSNVDNLKVYTYQKAIIDEIKYGQVGIQIDASATDFAVGEEIAVTTNNVKGIVQYRQTDPVDVLWIRLIELDDTSTINQTFITSNTIQGESKTATIINVFGDVLNINHNANVSFLTGMDVSASPTAGFGMVNDVDDSSNSLVLSHASGKILRSDQLYRLNPWNSDIGSNGSSLINLVGQVQTFYIDRQMQLPIQPILESPENNGVTFSITPPLPQGLVLDEETGKISIPESSTGPVASNLAYYTVIAKNLLGESKTVFGLKVREVFAIEDITGLDGEAGQGGEMTSPNLTSALHKFGQGYNNFPCRVTSDQVYSGDTANAKRAKDIYCIYDVGEADLFYNGLKLKMNVGPDLCQYVEHVPTWFYQYQVQTSIPRDGIGVTQNVDSVVVHSGDYMDILCSVAQPNDMRTQFPEGDPKDTCLGNYSGEGGPDCDGGSIPTIERAYSVADACVNPENLLPGVNPFPGVNSYQECFDATAECSDGTGTLTKDQCLTDPAGFTWTSNYVWVQSQCWLRETETSQTDCENNYGTCSTDTIPDTGATNRQNCETNDNGAWTPDGIWTNNATCDSIGQINGEDAECGGSQVNCIAGPAKDDENFPEDFLIERYQAPAVPAYGQVITVGDQEIKFTYASPKSKDYKSNLYLSNYSRLNQCTPHGMTPTSLNDYEYNINDWTSVGGLFDPADPGDPAIPNDGPSDFNPFAGGNTVYDYRCLDGARNVRARIRLLIREWDWNFKPSNTIDVMNLDNTPIGGGTNPSIWPDAQLMDAAGDFTNDRNGFSANSFNDWDDQTNIGGVCKDPNITYPGEDL